jgi:hypothetical protein
MTNIFRLYTTVDGYTKAAREIKAVLDARIQDLKAAQILTATNITKAADAIMANISDVLERYRKFGATDTDSREAMWEYVRNQLSHG